MSKLIGVDIPYSNQEVYRGKTVRSEVLHWMAQNCGGWNGWGIVDRSPDDPFAGETFEFWRKDHAMLFKLRWSGK